MHQLRPRPDARLNLSPLQPKQSPKSVPQPKYVVHQVPVPNRVVGGASHQSQALLALAQLLLDQLALGDVANEALKADGAVIGVQDGVRVDLNPDRSP